MHSDLISKIEKANRYAGERERIHIRNISVDFQGTHAVHLTTLKDAKWSCTCQFFTKWETCSHTMALQKILGDMLPEEARSPFA
ncbi:MAG: hypothetical protein PHV74_04050 [Dehalococcoidia bacterium]|nr:hypothetical protein [Dehalococcoidia bacterium]